MATTETIFESLNPSGQVDLENGVIRGVKLIGFKSKNGRDYPPAVLRAAVQHYEGTKVNIDHPEKGPTAQRSYKDRFGVIREARFVEGKGIYGDFHFNKGHSLAEQFCWDAENAPDAMGFSHNATMRMGRASGGREVVEEIVNVRSMDLVADPATTVSLFESENPQGTTEMDNDKMKEMEARLEAMTKENAELKAKLKEYSDKKDDDEMESLKSQLAEYQAKEKHAQVVESVNEQLKAAGLDHANEKQVSKLFHGQLVATESEDTRKAMIADRVGLLKATESQQPSYTPSTGTDVTESVDSVESFVSALTSR